MIRTPDMQGDSVARGSKLLIDNSLGPLATESPCFTLMTKSRRMRVGVRLVARMWEKLCVRCFGRKN